MSRKKTTKCKNSAFLKVEQIGFEQIAELANFPGVCSTAKISKWMTWIFCALCTASNVLFIIVIIAGKSSAGGKRELWTRRIYFDINIPAAYFNVWKPPIWKNLQCHKMISWVRLCKIWHSLDSSLCLAVLNQHFIFS